MKLTTFSKMAGVCKFLSFDTFWLDISMAVIYIVAYSTFIRLQSHIVMVCICAYTHAFSLSKSSIRLSIMPYLYTIFNASHVTITILFELADIPIQNSGI